MYYYKFVKIVYENINLNKMLPTRSLRLYQIVVRYIQKLEQLNLQVQFSCLFEQIPNILNCSIQFHSYQPESKYKLLISLQL
jgi:hypothetical protein